MTVGVNAQAVPAELEAIKTDLITVPGGSFMMGTTIQEADLAVDECALYGKTCNIEDTRDSVPSHQVTVDSFQIEQFEVTVDQYVRFLNFKGPTSHKNGCNGQPCALTTTENEYSYIEFDGQIYSVRNPQFYSTHPVTVVTWWGADAYCKAIGRRLPTEAEWERAARGTQNTIYPWGNAFDVNFAVSSASPEGSRGTVPVTSFPEGDSEYGIYNMAGNVEEWVSDWYSGTYYNENANNPQLATNPQGPPSGTEKVLRGGSWDTAPLFLRTVHRRSRVPGDPTTSMGFRCVEEVAATTLPLAPQSNTGGDAPVGAPTLSSLPTTAPRPSSTPGPTSTLAPG
jgi:formylglycine-generating enzyme required for sulfatase activity